MAQENIAETQVFTVREPAAAEAEISRAAGILREGGLVAFPTETVYGLGANALDAVAVGKIFTAKGRPADNPLIVHIAHLHQLNDLALQIPAEAAQLARTFWPGPLTLVLRKRSMVPDAVTCGLDSVAVRIPNHPVALALLNAAGVPVAAPSANASGRPSPTTAQHVLDDLAGRIDAVVDGGPCDVGVESTVLDIRDGCPLILRPGGVTPEQIAAVLGKHCPLAAWQEETGSAPPSPGLKYTHYAPRAPLHLVVGRPGPIKAKIRSLQQRFQRENLQVGLLLSEELAAELVLEQAGGTVEVLGSRQKPAELAANLYGALRRLDERPHVDVIVAEGYGEDGMGLALMNRMKKAAGPRVIEAEW